MAKIVVLGAGVSGLTCALQLAKRKENTVTVVAKHMPGDYDIEYTSPWAGANVLPMATKENSRWERQTWPELKRLATEVPEAGIHLQKAVVLRRKKDMDVDNPRQNQLSDSLFLKNPWYSTMFDDYRVLKDEELPEDMAYGCEFGSVCINTAIYLQWLVGQCLKHGVVLKRAVLKHISEASSLSHAGGKADIVINACGLLACRLGGVMDSTVKPARGQIILVRNELSPMYAMSSSDDGPEEIFYTMMRAGGGGTILGGTYAVGNWEANPDPNIANRIMKRVLDYHPQMKGKGVESLDIIRHGVGLRPYRTGGVRIEKEKIDGTWIVHNYGHAGWGYQGSYGCAEGVLELVDDILGKKSATAKL